LRGFGFIVLAFDQPLPHILTPIDDQLLASDKLRLFREQQHDRVSNILWRANAL
jgi:hypothetical protein